MPKVKDDNEFICERTLSTVGNSMTVNLPAAWTRLHGITKSTYRVRFTGSRVNRECKLTFIRLTEVDAPD